MKALKRLSLIMLCALIALLPVLAAAEESPTVIDFNRKGSITVTLRDDTEEHNALSGYSLRLYFVAEAVEENSQLVFSYTEPFAGCEFPLDDLNADGLAAALTAYTEENEVPFTVGTAGEEGSVVFEDLTLGLYLIAQETPAEGYYPITAFIVTVPMTAPDGSAWVYDIDASPKAETEPEQPVFVELHVSKEWQDEENEDRPTSVTINLLQDGEVIDTVVLNAENNWEHTFTDLPDGHSYIVEEDAIPAGYVVSYAYNEFSVVITNTAKIPQTGLNYTLVAVLAAVGILLLGAGAILMVRKARRDPSAM